MKTCEKHVFVKCSTFVKKKKKKRERKKEKEAVVTLTDIVDGHNLDKDSL